MMISYYSAHNNLGSISEYAEFNGKKYYKSNKGYYKQTNKPYTLLHQDVWKHYSRQEIPEGYDIHHIDHDNSNNSYDNLELLSKAEHAKRHHAENKSKEMICSACGIRFLSKSANAKFCKDCIVIHEKKRKAEWAKNNRERLSKKSLDAYHNKTYNEDRECEYCKKIFSINKFSPQRFCSRSCVAKATNKTKKGPRYNNLKAMFKCPVCGNEYETYKSGSNHTKTCSTKCSYQIRFNKS